MFANGGRRVKPTLIDRIRIVTATRSSSMDARECRGCDAPGGWKNQPEPQLIDRREQVLDTMTAYQITSMMEGVVQGGTAIAVKEVGKPIAGKTGTTNEAKDAWFIGFSPDIVVGIYLGFDKPRRSAGAMLRPWPSGRADRARLPQARARDKPAIPFKVPAGIKLIRVDAKSGMRAGPGDGGRPFSKPSSRVRRPPDNLLGHRGCRRRRPFAHRYRRMPTAASCARVPAGFIATRAPVALCSAPCRLHPV